MTIEGFTFASGLVNPNLVPDPARAPEQLTKAAIQRDLEAEYLERSREARMMGLVGPATGRIIAEGERVFYIFLATISGANAQRAEEMAAFHMTDTSEY